MLILVSLIIGCAPRPAVEATIAKFDGVNLYTLDYDGIMEIGEAAIPVLADLAENGDKAERFAAISFLSALGHQLDAKKDVLEHIKKAFEDEDISIRVTAAELALSFEDEPGYEVLIDSLGNNEMMIPSEPPTTIHQNSLEALKYYSGEDFEEIHEWKNWLATGKDIQKSIK